VKSPQKPDFHTPPDRTVVWWSALLLIALALVLTVLFYSGRFVLSLDHSEQETVLRVQPTAL
jgi:hypothetical protein